MFFVTMCNDPSRKLTVKLLWKGKETALRAGTQMKEETQLENFGKTTRQDTEIMNARNTSNHIAYESKLGSSRTTLGGT